MTKQADASLQSCADPASPSWAPTWAEEWVPRGSVVLCADLQVRRKLDAGAVRQYRDKTRAGSLPPPIRLARVPSGALLLVDGWHRWEAEALQTLGPTLGDEVEVLAEVASMSDGQARWQAAKANRDHGVPLKAKEQREVFRAFIKAGMHRLPRRGLMSYRELGQHLQTGHTTLRNWMAQDFPSLFRRMAGTDHGNSQATMPEAPDMTEVLRAQAIKDANKVRSGLPAMTPEGRRDVFQALQAVMAEAQALGMGPPLGASWEAF